MTAVAGAEAQVSPRTPAHPMAFTWEEFSYGMLWAVGAYQPLAALTMMIAMLTGTGMDAWAVMLAPIYLIVGGVVGIAVSILAMAFGFPVAYLLGALLSRCRREAVHVVAFALFGLALGLATMTVFSFVGSEGGRLSSDGTGWMMWFAVPAAIAVPLGQYRAVRRALRADAAERAVLNVRPTSGIEVGE